MPSRSSSPVEQQEQEEKQKHAHFDQNSTEPRQQQPPQDATTPASQQPLAVAAAAAALSAVGATSYNLLLSQPQLPPLSDVLGPALAMLIGGPLLALAVAKVVLGNSLHLELHRGRLYLQTGGPASGAPLVPAAVVVRPTGDARGNGAFAAAPIPAGTFLGDYTGELLDLPAFYARYPDGVGDFATAVDSEWTIDAVAECADTQRFHPVHMNSSKVRPNVRRHYRRAQRRISFFTTRDVLPGEELLYDYGRAYWRGREHLELP